MTLRVASLHVYPIKSLGGFSLERARTTDRGFDHDRRWMLTDAQGNFITQREVPAMACLHCSPDGDGFRVTDLRDGSSIALPWSCEGATTMAQVWSDRVRVVIGNRAWSEWFSDRLKTTTVLVHQPDSTNRRVDGRYAKGNTSLSDGFPYLVVSQASLDDLNARMSEPLPMDRFRPNIVIQDGVAFQEDDWKEVVIGDVPFSLVKPCARCVIPTTDQRTGERGKEPLRALSAYRAVGSKVLFGMNAMAEEDRTVHVGDVIRP